METKHTKGEWIIVRSKTIPNMVDSVRVQEWGNNDLMGDFRGCVIADFTESHGGRNHAFAEAEANAKLIAAAPDLLEACNLALTYIDYNIEHGCGGGNEAKYATVIEAAIKKAIE